MSNRVHLSSVAQINPRLPKGVEETQQVSFLSMASVSEEGKILRQETRKLSETKKGYTYFERNDVLLAKITPCFENGKAVLASDLEHPIGFGSTEFHVLRPDPIKLDPKYLFYLVWSKRFRYLGQKTMTGAAGQRRVPIDFLKNFEIPLPPLDDQKRIAHLLGKVEGLIAQRKHHLCQLDELLKSVFLKMFGDPVQNKKGWRKCFLQEGCSEIYRYPTFYGFEYSIEGIPVVRIGNILLNGTIDPELSNYVFVTKEISDRYPRTILMLNDILMAVRGDGSTGKRIGIIHSDNLVGANMSPNLLRMSCNIKVFNPIFFFHFLTSERGQMFISRNITRTAKKTITAENLKFISIPRPPIKLQNQFASIVEKVEILKSRYQQSLTDLESLYGALSQKAFKGELDLSRVPLPVKTTPARCG